jgi:ATP-dependent phosphofructokinase / diphosphate-dependent phosphofructokinase
MGIAVIAQGGGPTPVINASLAGVVREAREHREFRAFWGAEHGFRGILEGRFVDLFAQDLGTMEQIRVAPSSALGSSRDRLSDVDLEHVLDVFRKHDVRHFFHIGGNGSMGTMMDLDCAARDIGYDLRVVGIPKTVDNDLYGTDHTPGYGSAARFYAHAVRDMGMDHRALPSPILICEVIGRNVGWLAAATAFARNYEDDAPHLIYFPERPLSRHKLLSDVETAYRRWGRVFVTICEGQLDEHGEAFGADVDRPENPQHRLASNLAHTVGRLVARELKLRARSERPSLLARSCSVLASESDREEAELVGRAAVLAAVAGDSGQMVGLRREDGPDYRCDTVLVPLAEVARRERKLPDEFQDESGVDVTAAYLQYARPLVGSIPAHARLTR